MIEEQKHQVMPTTTQAVSPPTEKTVLAKKRGRGIRMIRMRVWFFFQWLVRIVMWKLEGVDVPTRHCSTLRI